MCHRSIIKELHTLVSGPL